MNFHAGKKNISKTHANSSSQSHNITDNQPSFRFIDNRPHVLAQRKLKEMANGNLPSLKTAQLKEMSNKYLGQLKRDSFFNQGVVILNNSPIQRKPSNINKTWNLDIQNNLIANQGAQRRARSVAWPRNKLIIGGNDPYTGGHLFKAEYGGPDNITNVVPWDDGAERKYATFEAAYKRSALKEAADNQGNYISEIAVSASFTEENKVKANTIKGYRDAQYKIKKPDIAKIVNKTLSLTPTKVKSKDKNGNEIELSQNDLGHSAIPSESELTQLLTQTDEYLEAIKNESETIEKGD